MKTDVRYIGGDLFSSVRPTTCNRCRGKISTDDAFLKMGSIDFVGAFITIQWGCFCEKCTEEIKKVVSPMAVKK
jgi:queuine/archaeosine tRNA-ribosyltransferase